jgi:hypothetical protein
MGKNRGADMVLVETPERKTLLGSPRRRCVRILLKWIFKEKDREWAGLIWLRIRISVGVL